MSHDTAQHEIEMVDALIAPIKSQYSDGIATVRATLVYATTGSATGHHERLALAQAHRFAADILGALDRISNRWGYTAAQVEVTGSYGKRVQVALTYELCTGEQAEADDILELFHDVIPAPEGV